MKTLNLKEATSLTTDTDRSMIDVTMAMEPDPSWFYTDAAGHEHRWSNSNRLRTLKEVVDRYDYDEDGERYVAESHYECKKCGETIKPRYREGRQTFIPGVTKRSFTLTVPMDSQLSRDALESLQADHVEKCLAIFDNLEQEVYVTSWETDSFGNVKIRLQMTGAPVMKGEAK